MVFLKRLIHFKFQPFIFYLECSETKVKVPRQVFEYYCGLCFWQVTSTYKRRANKTNGLCKGPAPEQRTISQLY